MRSGFPKPFKASSLYCTKYITASQIWVVPATGMYLLTMWAGGGGGAGGGVLEGTTPYGGCGGCSGQAVVRVPIFLVKGMVIPITIGVGGLGSTGINTYPYPAGNNGGATSLGEFLTVLGGKGGWATATSQNNNIPTGGGVLGGKQAYYYSSTLNQAARGGTEGPILHGSGGGIGAYNGSSVYMPSSGAGMFLFTGGSPGDTDAYAAGGGAAGYNGPGGDGSDSNGHNGADAPANSGAGGGGGGGNGTLKTGGKGGDGGMILEWWQ